MSTIEDQRFHHLHRQADEIRDERDVLDTPKARAAYVRNHGAYFLAALGGVIDSGDRSAPDPHVARQLEEIDLNQS